MKLIVLSGFSGSGKDTFADYLVKMYGYVKCPFAASLKEMTSKKYNVPIEYFNKEDLKDVPYKNLKGIISLFLMMFLMPGLTSILFMDILTRLQYYSSIIALIIAWLSLILISNYNTIDSPRQLLIKYGAELRTKDPLIFIKETFKQTHEKMIISDCRLPNELKYIQKNYKDNYIHIWVNRSEDKINKNDDTQITPDQCLYQIENKGPLDLVGIQLEKQLLKQDKTLKSYFNQ